MNSLFAYPGNKRSIVKSLDYVDSGLFIDPFVGAASFLLHNYQRNPDAKFIVADKDPAIQSILYVCKSNKVRLEVLEIANELKDEFLDKPTKTWNKIKKNLRNRDNILVSAASKLVYQRIAHGGIPRTCADGKTPNVIWSVDKALGIKNWKPELPDLSGCNLTILNDWKQALLGERGIILLDPPYYAPGKTACYPGHKPGSVITLMMVLKAIETAIATNPLQLFITHYECDYIDGLLTNYEDSFKITKRIGGELQALNYGGGNHQHGIRSSDLIEYKDCIWELRRNG